MVEVLIEILELSSAILKPTLYNEMLLIIYSSFKIFNLNLLKLCQLNWFSLV